MLLGPSLGQIDIDQTAVGKKRKRKKICDFFNIIINVTTYLLIFSDKKVQTLKRLK